MLATISWDGGSTGLHRTGDKSMLTTKTKTSQHQDQQDATQSAGALTFLDQRPSTVAQRELVQMMQDSPRTAQLRAMKKTLSKGGAPVQRALITHKPNAVTTSDERVADAYAIVIDELVDKSYQEFMQGDYSGASAAQIALYKRRKSEFDKAKASGEKYQMHPSTAAGYVIEGKANSKILAQLSNVRLQVADVMQGTRPDIQFQIPDKAIYGLVDITASSSAGHIFSKKGNWINQGNIIHVSESVYPSIDFESMSPITLSDEDLQQIKAHAEEKALLAAEFFEFWFERYAEVQNHVLQALETYNNNNEKPFSGTATQVDRLMEAFVPVGISVFPQFGETKLLIHRIDFVDQKGVDSERLIPFKVDFADAEKLIDKLKKFNIP
jgi:hypothetical protein